MRLVAVGDNCMDVYTNGDIFPGGNSVNVAVYTARLGGSASYVGFVGTDKNGKAMIEAVKNKNVDVSCLEISEGKTAVTQVELVNGERIFGDYDEGVLENFKLTEKQKNFIYTHDLVVSGLWGNVHDEFKDFHQHGLITAFDAATSPHHERTKAVLPYLNYFFYSIEEGNDSPELREEMRAFHAKGLKVIVVTMGEHGSIAFDGTTFTKFGIFPVEVVDTIGAGDSYIAGFLKGILEGKELKECMEIGARTASETISYFGSWK